MRYATIVIFGICLLGLLVLAGCDQSVHVTEQAASGTDRNVPARDAAATVPDEVPAAAVPEAGLAEIDPLDAYPPEAYDPDDYDLQLDAPGSWNQEDSDQGTQGQDTYARNQDTEVPSASDQDTYEPAAHSGTTTTPGSSSYHPPSSVSS